MMKDWWKPRKEGVMKGWFEKGDVETHSEKAVEEEEEEK